MNEDSLEWSICSAIAREPDRPEDSDDGLPFDPAPPPRPIPTEVEGWREEVFQVCPGADPAYVESLLRESSPEFLEALLRVPDLGRGPTLVRDHILKKGSVNHMDPDFPRTRLGKKYDPQVIHDFARRGFPLRNVDAFTLTLDPLRFRRLLPKRDTIPAQVRAHLIPLGCAFCGDRATLLDHRVPFDLVGNDLTRKNPLEALQPTCKACNTEKGKACLRCPDFQDGSHERCFSCYYAYPGKGRRVVFVASSEEDQALLRRFQEEWDRRHEVRTD